MQTNEGHQPLHQLYQQNERQSIPQDRPVGLHGAIMEQARAQVDPDFRQRYQRQHRHQIGSQSPPASSYQPSVEYAHSQNAPQPQGHPNSPLEGQDPRLFTPVSLDPDLLYQDLHTQEDDHSTMRADRHDSGRSRKGKEKEAGDSRGEGKGKGKKQPDSESQSSSSTESLSTESLEQPSWAAHKLLASIESTSGLDQASIDIDDLIEKRLEVLKNTDAHQRRELGLPSRLDHDILACMKAKNPPNWQPNQPRTQSQFEKDRKKAKRLIKFAESLLETPDLTPDVFDLCKKVTTASANAKGEPKTKSKGLWRKYDSRKRKAQGLPSIEDLSEMETILFGGPRTEQPKSDEESEEGRRTAGKVLDHALARLKQDKPLRLESARPRLLTICSKIMERRDGELARKRQYQRTKANR